MLSRAAMRLLTAVPTLLVVIFASFLFQTGVEFWFSDKSRGLIENANQLARAYYEQTERDLELESLAMAADLGDFLSREAINSPAFPEYYGYQVQQRKISESTILQKGTDGGLHRAAFARGPEPLSEQIAAGVLRQLDGGSAIVVSSTGNSIQAVTPIDRRSGIYLYAGRTSDLLAFSQGQRAENIVRDYEVLTARARQLQLRFNIALFAASLAIVGLAVWFALSGEPRAPDPGIALTGDKVALAVGLNSLLAPVRQAMRVAVDGDPTFLALAHAAQGEQHPSLQESI